MCRLRVTLHMLYSRRISVLPLTLFAINERFLSVLRCPAFWVAQTNPFLSTQCNICTVRLGRVERKTMNQDIIVWRGIKVGNKSKCECVFYRSKVSKVMCVFREIFWFHFNNEFNYMLKRKLFF